MSAGNPTEDLLNTTITIDGNSYHLISIVSDNGFSTVFRCVRERENPLFYACKVIAKRGRSEENVRRLIGVAEIMRRLHHQNVIELHDFAETADFIFFVMPFFEGGTLHEKLHQRGRFSEADSRRIVIQIARGLAYLHAEGICHRDIKLDNILCSGEEEDFRVVIYDFSLSAHFREGERMRTICGTPAYTAPEIFRGDRPYTEACDIWSLGVVAYTLLVGSYLPNAEDRPGFILDFPDGIQLSVAAREFLARLLAENPNERPTASYLLNEDPWLNAT